MTAATTTTTEAIAPETKLTADRLNAHLAAGGVVQVTTYLRSTLYTAKHAGWFSEDKSGVISVRQGRGKVRLTLSNGRWLVGVRLGRVS